MEYSRDTARNLLTSKGQDLEDLYRKADTIRRQNMGDEIYIRAIVEFSNVCAYNCLYCGIRASNKNIRRYSMTADEIVEAAFFMEKNSLSTIVLQSGESPGVRDEEIGEIIRRIKKETSLAVTVSVGNRSYETYKYWLECGMDRYFLRFETSDPLLFETLHPGCTLKERLNCLEFLRDLGVQTGSGFMIGLPGETLDVLAGNILLCREFDLDMIGIGPFIPHPDTPLGDAHNVYLEDPEIFFKALAVLRIFNPESHIPATTAFDAVFSSEGRTLALQRGANIFMPNSTPAQYRKDYLLYPGKPGVDEDPDECIESAIVRIQSLGRSIGKGPGHSIKYRVRGSEDSRIREK